MRFSRYLIFVRQLINTCTFSATGLNSPFHRFPHSTMQLAYTQHGFITIHRLMKQLLNRLT